MALACSSVSIKTQYDAERDFTRYQTFAWMPDSSAPKPGPLETPRFRTRFEQAVEQTLETKGLRRVPPSAAPDLLVDYRAHLRLDRDVWVSNWPNGAVPTLEASPGYPGYEWDQGSVEARDYETARLVLDVFDARTHELIWSGTARGMVDADLTQKLLLTEGRDLARDFPRSPARVASVPR